MVPSTGLANAWPAGGPRRLWTRALGEGHSAILFENGRLYTQYRPLGVLAAVRRSQEEVIAALDAASGKTIWEHRYPSPTSGVNFTEGAVPHVTPLIVGIACSPPGRAASSSRSTSTPARCCGRTT